MENKHNLPPCPKCSGGMKIGQAMGGPRIYCNDYAYCGGILPFNIQPQSAVALGGGDAGEGTLSLESRDDSKKVDTFVPQVKTCLSSPEGLPSPGSANFRRMQNVVA